LVPAIDDQRFRISDVGLEALWHPDRHQVAVGLLKVGTSEDSVVGRLTEQRIDAPAGGAKVDEGNSKVALR
jgi:hypothetical protein